MPRRGNSLPVVSPERPWLISLTPRLDRAPTKKCSDDRLKTKTSRREAVRVRDRRPQRPRGDRYFSAEAPSSLWHPRSLGTLDHPAARQLHRAAPDSSNIYIYILVIHYYIYTNSYVYSFLPVFIIIIYICTMDDVLYSAF